MNVEEQLQARVVRISQAEPYQAEARSMVTESKETQHFCCEDCDPAGKVVSVFQWQCKRCPANDEEISTREAAHAGALDHLEIHAWDDPKVFDDSPV